MARTAPAYTRPCRRKLHTIPPGVLTCPECAAAREQERVGRVRAQAAERAIRSAVPGYRLVPLPPAEVLNNAACSLATAELFDLALPGELQYATETRHARARAICRGCPVWEQCLADAQQHQRPGVYGGRVLRWPKDNALGVVQVMPVVQDSAAC